MNIFGLFGHIDVYYRIITGCRLKNISCYRFANLNINNYIFRLKGTLMNEVEESVSNLSMHHPHAGPASA